MPKTLEKHPHLEALLEDLTRSTEQIQSLIDLPAEELTRKPDPKKWSILEVIEHLRVTGELYYVGLRKAIEKARTAGGDAAEDFKPSAFARLFLHLAGPNPKMRVKAPSLFRPEPAFDDVSAIPRLIADQEVLRGLLRDANGCNLNRTKFPSPISSMLKFTIGSGLTLMVRHQQRHLQQIDGLRTK